jgi:hypothetical protein
VRSTAGNILIKFYYTLLLVSFSTTIIPLGNNRKVEEPLFIATYLLFYVVKIGSSPSVLKAYSN